MRCVALAVPASSKQGLCGAPQPRCHPRLRAFHSTELTTLAHQSQQQRLAPPLVPPRLFAPASARASHTTMGALAAWTYPLRGVTYLTTTPRLLGRVAKFLGLTTGVSAVLGLAWFRLAWSAHMRFIASILGSGFLATAATIVLLLGEAAVPVTVLFSRRLESLQGQLFDETLKLRGATVHSVDPAERERLAAFLSKQRQKGKAKPPKINLPGALGSVVNTVADFAYNVVVPRPKEGFLVRRTRDMVTLPVKVSLPMLLPVFALAMDGPAEAAALHQRWLDSKGLKSSDEQLAVMQRHKHSYRAFGAVASSLNYIPVLSWFLSLSNAVGAALWAADIEKQGGALFTAGGAMSAARGQPTADATTAAERVMQQGVALWR